MAGQSETPFYSLLFPFKDDPNFDTPSFNQNRSHVAFSSIQFISLDYASHDHFLLIESYNFQTPSPQACSSDAKYCLAVDGTTVGVGPFGLGRCVSTASIGSVYLQNNNISIQLNRF